MLPINEMFETMQGEATFTGSPAVFLRFQGCPVGCPWCDTKHTWTLPPENETTLPHLLVKTAVPDARYAMASVSELTSLIDLYRARHVVITGGEPCLSDLVPLTTTLLATGRSVQVETSGTFEIRVAHQTWVTVSPKVDMPGGLEVRADAVARADEVKWPVGKSEDVTRLQAFLAAHNYGGPVWLQPLSRSAKATALCLDAATSHGWRVSVQVHAFIGVR